MFNASRCTCGNTARCDYCKPLIAAVVARESQPPAKRVGIHAAVTRPPAGTSTRR